MDIKDKLTLALMDPLECEYIRLEEEDGISGFIVTSMFEGMSNLDRQTKIDDAIRKSPSKLTPKEYRKVLMIAGLTPAEYSFVGARIRVYQLNEIEGGVQVVVHGTYSDAKYVRGVFNKMKGVQTSEPQQSRSQIGVLMTFQATGKKAPLSKHLVIRALMADPYIQVMPDA